MATAQDVINEWAAESDEKQALVSAKPALVLRWINQAQLRFAEKSECLRSLWTPTITSTGNIALPTDFLREFPDLVQWDVNTKDRLPLKKIDYQVARLRTFSLTSHYSIYNGTFYVWNAGALTPAIPYIKKPTILSAIASDLEIPTEFQNQLVFYMDLMYDKANGKINSIDKETGLRMFDQNAYAAGLKYRNRNDGLVVMRSNRLG